jgi:hypothetical protein
MDPSNARAYVKQAIDTETGKQAIRRAFPKDASTIIGTAGEAMTDDAIVEIATTLRETLVQSYNL